MDPSQVPVQGTAAVQPHPSPQQGAARVLSDPLPWLCWAGLAHPSPRQWQCHSPWQWQPHGVFWKQLLFCHSGPDTRLSQPPAPPQREKLWGGCSGPAQSPRVDSSPSPISAPARWVPKRAHCAPGEGLPPAPCGTPKPPTSAPRTAPPYPSSFPGLWETSLGTGWRPCRTLRLGTAG